MARGGGKRRTYARDNRGRFASTGATARGGRLKTAAGNKRKTVTARMAPAKAAGTIGKRKGLKARPEMPATKQLSARGKVRQSAPATAPVTAQKGAQGRRKPLKNIGSVLGKNLQGFKGLPVEVRSRKQSGRRQAFRSNELGKKVSAERGFNEAVGKRQSFVDSTERRVYSRQKIKQANIFGGVQTVGAGRFKPVGERTASGRVYKPRAKPRPIPGSKSYRRQLDRAIKSNGGKDVAAFRF